MMSMKPSKALDRLNCWRYSYPAPHKTGAGIRTPNMYTATSDAASVFFVVRYTRHSMAWCVIRQRSYNRRYVALLAYHAAHNGTICGCCVRLRPVIDAQNRISRRPIMVTLAGQPQGWPVSVYAGSSNPVNVTAPIERSNSSGDSVNMYAEALTMVNASPCPYPLFVWRFFLCQQSTYHTVTATSE
ncbi:ash family protein, partial [Salmonella enterica subsp. diarizonae serovar 60:r:e,n,x,z15]|nr:ash family protein [Salmonella enterica subsp. diarizonae serovar 60:r:e,n,x,z15]